MNTQDKLIDVKDLNLATSAVMTKVYDDNLSLKQQIDSTTDWVAYLHNQIENLPSPMVFKGSLGTGGTITSLPTASTDNEGYTYKVITAGTYASQAAKIGDMFISDGSTWVYVPSADEPSGTVTSVTLKATSPIAIDSSSAITTSGTRTISHGNSGVTAGTYRSVTVNATGHVTAGTNPTTLSGYGITDAKIADGVITLGSNTITPLTSSSTLDATKLSGTIPSSCYTVPTKTSDLTNDSGYITSTTANDTYALKSLYGATTINVGRKTDTTTGSNSTAEGWNTEASADYSHSEGEKTVSSASAAHAEGSLTKATKRGAHVEGVGSQANGIASHAEGYYTTANGDYSHAEGYYSHANGIASHAEGYMTYATSDYQHVIGKYNKSDANNTYVEIVGNGADSSHYSNARTLDWSGNEVLAGSLTINGNQTVATLNDIPTVPTKTSDLTNDSGYVTNTDYAGSANNSGGTVVLKTTYCTDTNSSGVLYCFNRTYSQYASMDNSAFISKGTLENVIAGKNLVTLDDIVKPTATDLLSGSVGTITNNGAIDLKTEMPTPIDPTTGTGGDYETVGEILVDYNGTHITGLVDPTEDTDAVNKKYVGNVSSLNTTTKTDLVSAINEVNSNMQYGVILYENDSGSIESSIPLNDSAANYQYIEIYYRTNDSDYSSVKVYQPNGKRVAINSGRVNSAASTPTFYGKTKTVYINNNTMTVVDNAIAQYTVRNATTGNVAAGDMIYITRVIGYTNTVIPNEAEIEDTGWINLTLLSGASAGANGAVPAIRRIGTHVFVRGSIAFTASSSSSVGLAEIPEGFRPAGQAYKIGATGGATYARFYYTVGGSIGCDWVYNTGGSRYSGSVTWSNIDMDWFTD